MCFPSSHFSPGPGRRPPREGTCPCLLPISISISVPAFLPGGTSPSPKRGTHADLTLPPARTNHPPWPPGRLLRVPPTTNACTPLLVCHLGFCPH